MLKAFFPLVLLAAAPMPLAAQESPVQEAVVQPLPADNHERFYQTVLGASDQELILDNMVREISAQLVESDPNYIAMERIMPGIGADLIDAIKPVIRQYRNRTMAQYAPQLIDLSREIFTNEEAGQLADFYGSPVGRRLMQAISGNISSQNRLGPAISDKEVTASAITGDDRATLRDTLQDLSDEDLRAIARFSLRVPASARLPEYSRRSMPIRLAMENELPNAEEMALLQDTVRQFMQQRLGTEETGGKRRGRST